MRRSPQSQTIIITQHDKSTNQLSIIQIFENLIAKRHDRWLNSKHRGIFLLLWSRVFFQNFAKCSDLICWISLPPTFGTFIAKKKGKFANFRAFRYFKTRARISKRFYSSSANGEAEEQMDWEGFLCTEKLPLKSVSGEHGGGENKISQ